jgi:hypothetical protein
MIPPAQGPFSRIHGVAMAVLGSMGNIGIGGPWRQRSSDVAEARVLGVS